jgi:chromosome segregation ATPase
MTEERTRFEVLLESIETKVNVIAEGHGALVERLDRMERRFEARFDGLESRFDGLESRFDGLESRFNGLESRFNGLESRFNGLETKVDRLETKVDRVETKVDRVETKIDGLETKVDGLEVFASDAQGRLKRIETHLQLKRANRSAPRHIATSAALSKRRRKR